VTEPAADVPPGIVAELRSVCLRLPEVHEEDAWVGTRWRIRTKTFAHVLTIDAGWPPHYARAAGSDGPITVLTFRAPLLDVDAYRETGHPYFLPGWWDNIVGMVLEPDVDWAEVGELLTESYCVLAPKKLVDLVDRPTS
jgi:hypothetical protein